MKQIRRSLGRVVRGLAASLILVLGGLEAGNAQAEEGRLLAWIEIDASERIVKFRAYAGSDEAVQARYRLSITKTGGGGQSTSSQGGLADLTGGSEPVLLSTVGLNIDEDTAYEVVLTLTGEDGTEVTAQIQSPTSKRL